MFDFQPHLCGELIRVDPLDLADFDGLAQCAADPQIWALHPATNRWQRPAFEAYLRDALGDRGGLVVRDLASGAMIGFSRYSQRFSGPGRIEIGWTFLDRAHWGGGYNADLKRVMLKHALAYFDRALFRTGADNLRSRRAVEKIGARQIDWDEVVMIEGRAVVHVGYEIDRDAFANGPLGG